MLWACVLSLCFADYHTEVRALKSEIQVALIQVSLRSRSFSTVTARVAAKCQTGHPKQEGGVHFRKDTGPTSHLRVVVFSAQKHEIRNMLCEDGKHHHISCPIEPAHLYVIRPGHRQEQLTRGASGDLAPRYSPSMDGILFVRHSKSNQLMLMPNGSTKPKIINKIPDGFPSDAAISASGRAYTVALSTNPEFSAERRERVVCLFDGAVVKTFDHVDQNELRNDRIVRYQIIPGTETVYIQLDDKTSFLFDCITRKLTKSWSSTHDIFWRSANKALSIDRGRQDVPGVAVYDQTGSLLSKVNLTGENKAGMGPDDLLPQADRFQSDSVIVEDESHISDGIHPSCSRLNLQTGILTELFDGAWLDTNDQGEFLSITYDWVGYYKHGNFRTGFLHRSDPKGKHEHQLTKYPYAVTSACWWTG